MFVAAEHRIAQIRGGIKAPYSFAPNATEVASFCQKKMSPRGRCQQDDYHRVRLGPLRAVPVWHKLELRGQF